MAKNKNKNKNRNKQPKYDPYNPNSILTGKNLKKYVRQQVKAQARPEIQGAKNFAKALEGILGFQTANQLGQTNQALTNVRGYYEGLRPGNAQALAAQQAAGMQLRGDVAASGREALNTIGAGADTSKAALDTDPVLALQQPSSARQQLDQIVAAQQSGTSNENAANNAWAQLGAGGWQGALAMMQGATQQQGGVALQNIAKQGQLGQAEILMQMLPDLLQAKQDVKDARSKKRALKSQLLNETIDRERQFLLSKGALGIDRKALKQENAGIKGQLKLAHRYGKNKKREQMRSLQNQLKVAEAQGQNKKAEQIRSLMNQLRVQQGYGSGSGGGKNYDRDQYLRAKDVTTNVIREMKAAGHDLGEINTKKKFDKTVAMIVRNGANSAAARAALRKAIQNYKKRNRNRGNNLEQYGINVPW